MPKILEKIEKVVSEGTRARVIKETPKAMEEREAREAREEKRARRETKRARREEKPARSVEEESGGGGESNVSLAVMSDPPKRFTFHSYPQMWGILLEIQNSSSHLWPEAIRFVNSYEDMLIKCGKESVLYFQEWAARNHIKLEYEQQVTADDSGFEDYDALGLRPLA